MDFFAGSGTVGEAAYRLGRRFILVDNNREALEVMAKRFADFDEVQFVGFDPEPSHPTGRQARPFTG